MRVTLLGKDEKNEKDEKGVWEKDVVAESGTNQLRLIFPQTNSMPNSLTRLAQ